MLDALKIRGAKPQKRVWIMLKLKKKVELVKTPEKVKRSSKKDAPLIENERKKRNELPKDVYTDEIPCKQIIFDVDRHIVVSVKRGGELGLPCLDIRWYQTTQTYTGFTKKGINIPLDLISDLIDTLADVQDECDKKGLFDEDEEE